MSSLPQYRPQKLSLGSLETEILEILWDLKKATVKQIHDHILSDLERELAYLAAKRECNTVLDAYSRRVEWKNVTSSG